jgi:putative membrane protein
MKILFGVILLNFYAVTLSAQNAVSDRDMKFAKEAAEGGIMEVKLGELAQSKGNSTDVKNLGAMMVKDHSEANGELKQLAGRKNISLPTEMNEKGQKTYEKLSQRQGKDFDKAYTHCMVKDHRKDICKFRKESKKGDDTDLKQWAGNKLPTLEHHKEMSKNACKATKKE